MTGIFNTLSICRDDQFIKIVRNLMPLFEEKHNIQFEELMDCLKEDRKYDTIRVTEPDMFPKRSLPLV